MRARFHFGLSFSYALSFGLAFFTSCGSPTPQLEESSLASLWQDQLHNYQGPDDEMTPGHLCTTTDGDFDGRRHPEKIPHCRRNVDSATKKQIKANYGIPVSEYGKYQIDHFIPLNIGGSNRLKNLWPLYAPVAIEKSQFEYFIMGEVAAGRLSQAQGVEEMHAWRPEGRRR